jgi:hypothetical protein
VRFFTLIDFQHLILALFLGLAAALVIYLAFRYTGKRQPEEDSGEGADTAPSEYPEGFRIEDNPVPPVLILLFLGFIVWFIFYVIIFGIHGGPV